MDLYDYLLYSLSQESLFVLLQPYEVLSEIHLRHDLQTAGPHFLLMNNKQLNNLKRKSDKRRELTGLKWWVLWAEGWEMWLFWVSPESLGKVLIIKIQHIFFQRLCMLTLLSVLPHLMNSYMDLWQMKICLYSCCFSCHSNLNKKCQLKTNRMRLSCLKRSDYWKVLQEACNSFYENLQTRMFQTFLFLG